MCSFRTAPRIIELLLGLKSGISDAIFYRAKIWSFLEFRISVLSRMCSKTDPRVRKRTALLFSGKAAAHEGYKCGDIKSDHQLALDENVPQKPQHFSERRFQKAC